MYTVQLDIVFILVQYLHPIKSIQINIQQIKTKIKRIFYAGTIFVKRKMMVENVLYRNIIDIKIQETIYNKIVWEIYK